MSWFCTDDYGLFSFLFYRAVFDAQKETFSSVPMNMDNLYRAAFDA